MTIYPCMRKNTCFYPCMVKYKENTPTGCKQSVLFKTERNDFGRLFASSKEQQFAALSKDLLKQGKKQVFAPFNTSKKRVKHAVFGLLFSHV